MTSFQKIDINCDLGEGKVLADCQRDALLMPFISSCNIACGEHAGNLDIIRKSLQNAKQHQLKIGAHPGYPDKQNFGRKTLDISRQQLIDSLRMQLDRIITIGIEEEVELSHIKLHGALYNDAESKTDLALELAGFFSDNYPHLKILSLAGGEFNRACKQIGLGVISEGFMDRAYLADGKLMPRNLPGAVFSDVEKCVEQALKLAEKTDKSVDSICLHGDNSSAVSIAKKVSVAMANAGVVVQ